ncbi:MAG: hypothetical protein WDM89_01235 [Rhizomicrobium sp.]
MIGAVGDAIGGTSFSSNGMVDNALHGIVVGAAGLIASAATRSLITGTDFGDNILKGPTRCHRKYHRRSGGEGSERSARTAIQVEQRRRRQL